MSHSVKEMLVPGFTQLCKEKGLRASAAPHGDSHYPTRKKITVYSDGRPILVVYLSKDQGQEAGLRQASAEALRCLNNSLNPRRTPILL